MPPARRPPPYGPGAREAPGRVSLEKAALRRRVLQGTPMPAEDRARRSVALARRLLATPRWQAAAVVAGFVGRGHEPDTKPILRQALARGLGLLLPRVASKDPPRLVFCPVDDLDALRPGAFGIEEPSGPPVPLPPGALLLVPALAVDPAGNRLGHGFGYYDRVLAAADAPRSSVALVLDPFVLDRVPADPWDVPVAAVVTDRRVVDPCTRPPQEPSPR